MTTITNAAPGETTANANKTKPYTEDIEVIEAAQESLSRNTTMIATIRFI